MTDQSAFQKEVRNWTLACFGPEISADKIERNHRFIEEALELVQAAGCTRSEAHQLVDYVFDRPVGEINQEVGGVMVTLAVLCNAQQIWMQRNGEVELKRVWTKVEQIRAKQAAKPKHSPLPMMTIEEAGTVRREALRKVMLDNLEPSSNPDAYDPYKADRERLWPEMSAYFRKVTGQDAPPLPTECHPSRYRPCKTAVGWLWGY